VVDYYPIISRAVARLENNNHSNRAVLYDRARTALVAQLTKENSGVGEAQLQNEVRALEEAILTMETEAARIAGEATPHDVGLKADDIGADRAPDALAGAAANSTVVNRSSESASKQAAPPATAPQGDPSNAGQRTALADGDVDRTLGPITEIRPASNGGNHQMAEIGADGPGNAQVNARPSKPRRPLTDVRESLAYFVVQLIRIAVTYEISSANILTPVYQWAYHAGGAMTLLPLSLGLSALWLSLALPVFLAARGLFGGTPTIISRSGGARAIASSGSEIGAYALAHLIGIVVLYIANIAFLSSAYLSLRREDHAGFGVALGIAASLVAAIIMFVLFCYLRRAFAGAANTAAEGQPRGVGSNSAVQRPDLIGVGGWLLFFCIALTILAPIFSLIGITATLATSPSSAVLDRYPGLTADLWIEIVARLGLTGFSLYAGSGLWSIRPNAVDVAKNFLATNVLVAFILPFIEVLVAGLPSEASGLMFIEGMKGFIPTLAGFLIWFNYLNRSVRVRVTYQAG
jgi:hypothetical protein